MTDGDAQKESFTSTDPQRSSMHAIAMCVFFFLGALPCLDCVGRVVKSEFLSCSAPRWLPIDSRLPSPEWDVSYPAVGISHTLSGLSLLSVSRRFIFAKSCATGHRVERYNHVVVHGQVLVPANSISGSAVFSPYPLMIFLLREHFRRSWFWAVWMQSEDRTTWWLRAAQVPVHGVPRAVQERWADSTVSVPQKKFTLGRLELVKVR